MAGMMGASLGTPSMPRQNVPSVRQNVPSVRVAEGPADTMAVDVIEEEPGNDQQAQQRQSQATSRSSRASGNRRSEASGRRSDASRQTRPSQTPSAAGSHTSRTSRGSAMSTGSNFSGMGASANMEPANISQAWNLPEDEINPRDLRKLKKILAMCCLGTMVSFAIGASGVGFDTPMREALLAGGFAIVPMLIWLSFCRCLPFLAPRPRPAEYRIWARALFKDLEQPMKFSSMKVIRIKGEKPILKCLGDVQDIQKGLAVLRIQKNCSCCLKEYEPEDRVAVLLCGHIFCETCLGDWVVSGKKAGSMCPICRFDFTTESVDPEKIEEEETRNR